MRPLHLYYPLFIALLFITNVLGQHKIDLDSLKKEVNVLVYNNPELAIKKGLELYKLSNEKPSYQVSALIFVANGYAVLKEHDEVFKYALKADSVAAVNKNYTDQVRALGFIGGQYRRLQLSKRALNYLDKAYNLTIEHPLPDSLDFIQGNILVVKGLIKKDDLDCSYALPYFKDAVKVFKKNSDRNSVKINIAITLNNIGDCNIALENYDEAKANFNEAIIYAKQSGAIKNIATARLGLAKLLSIEGKIDEAIVILEDALISIKELNDAAINSEILKALSENYLLLNNDQKHNFYTKLYLEEEHKILGEEKKSLNKVTKEIATENQEKRQDQKNKYTYAFIVSGLVLSVIIFLIYRKITTKRRKISISKEIIQKSSKTTKQ
ncbi:hypothetical protein SCB49_11502 [unidentified eubacterium SCB49]|nr:hypothetical protein SCB49_11502 [unidentified eubacterium SCB49]